MIGVGLTDRRLFEYLRAAPCTDLVNFWTPTPWRIRSLHAGDYCYFLLKAPWRAIGGYGVFVGYEEMPVSAAWRRYGPANGVSDRVELRERTRRYALLHARDPDLSDDPVIGCIILRDAVFLDDDQ